ncbi:DUF1772 domain-containing protein [Nocardiopsis sp. CC223A]|uniref:DUF1772 domain-containing protein n=1 Tax=Nocardiopsis sp. CC223A TaxID=3044051 RepID=UPI00278C0E70|nr:DUF1772 domain-containing protein [Nocardiopsis sp. CC223A]
MVYQVVLVITLFGAGLAAGLFFTFTVLIIPGLVNAEHRLALRGFQAIDRRLQPTTTSVDWQPAFGAVLFGTSILTVATAVLGWPHVTPAGRALAVAAAAFYNVGCWWPTLATILPFNNRVRDIDLDTVGSAELETLYRDFRRNWSGWNLVRTGSSAAAFALLIALVAVG